MEEIKKKLKEWGSICRISNIKEDPLTFSYSDMLSFAKYYHESQAKNNESLHLVSESDIKDVTEKWVKSMLHSDEIKEDDCRYNFNHGVRIGIELSKKANSH